MPTMKLDQLPDQVRSVIAPDEQAKWMEVFNEVFAETGDETMATLAAWGAVQKSQFIRGQKSAEKPMKVGGWAVLFGSQADKDTDNQYFTDQTAFLTDYYRNAPLFMEHGMRDGYGSRPIGMRSRTVVTRHGIWLEHVLDQNHPLYEQTAAEVEGGKFAYSSDSILHYVKAGLEDDGHLGLWFLAGCSLTEDPAEPGLGPVTIGELETIGASKSARGRDVRTLIHEVAYGTKSELKGHPPMLEQIAQFLGVNADPQTVVDALTALIAQLNGQAADAAASQFSIDMPTLKTALKMEDKPDEEIAAALQSMLDGLKADAMIEEEEEPVAGKSRTLDYSALSSVAAFMAAKTASREGNKIPHATGQKTRKPGQLMTAPNYNRGVPVPGLANLVKAVVDKKSEGAIKAMGYSAGPTGGYFLRQETSSEMIELFRAQTIVAQLGATFIPMRGIETLTYRKQLTGAEAGYRGEGQAAAEEKLTFGTVVLNLKELIASTKPNRRLLRNSDTDLERMLRDDLQTALNLRADLAAIRGTGGVENDGNSTGSSPVGVRYTTGVTVTSLGTNGGAPDIDDFVDAWGRIEDANVPASNSWGIAFSPRTRRYMANLTDTTGQLLPDTRWSDGHKYEATTQISNALTVGTSSDCSEVYFGDWQYLIVGMGSDIEIIVNDSRYIELGEIYIEASMMHDVAVAQPTAFEVLTGVRAV